MPQTYHPGRMPAAKLKSNANTRRIGARNAIQKPMASPMKTKPPTTNQLAPMTQIGNSVLRGNRQCRTRYRRFHQHLSNSATLC